MKLSRCLASLPLLVLLCGSSFVAGREPPSKDVRQQRGIVEQPRTFANTILFQEVDGHVVRSDRFTGEGGLFGDFDGDDDIDLHDFNAMQICLSFSGPELTAPPACDVFDVDSDGDIDMKDTDAFMQVFTGTLSGVLVEAGTLRPVQSSPEGYYSGEPGTDENNALNATAAQAGYSQDDLWYVWSVTEQPKGSGIVLLSNASKPATAYSVSPALLSGLYLFELTVTNLVTLEFATDTVSLTVSERPQCPEDGDCDDFDPCTDDFCDSATGECSNIAVDCPIGEVCDAATGACMPACEQDAECDDGLFCTGTESCGVDNLCISTGDPCAAAQICDEAQDRCDTPGCIPIMFTLGSDNLVGGGLGDCFRAPLIFNPPTGTNIPSLQTGDQADGGGGDDVLNAQFNFTASTTVFPTLTDIETLNITDFGTAATWLFGTNLTGVTDINMSNGTNGSVFTVNNLPTIANVGVSQQVVGATLTFQTAATSGATDAVTVTLNGMAGGTITLTSGATNGFETMNIIANGNASAVFDIAMNGTTLTRVNITGDADFTHTASLDANVTVINCSAATGDITLTQTNAGILTYTGGAGDDSIVLGATYGTTDPIDGGPGTDTLGGTTAVLGGTTVAQSNVTNIEVLRVSNAHTTVLDLSHFGTITGVTLDVGSNGGTIINASTGFNLACGRRAGAASVGAGTLATTVSGSATSDSATFTMSDCEQAGAVTFNGVETLNLVSNLDLDGSAANSGTANQNTFTGTLILTDTAASEKIVITGTEQLNLTGAVTANEIDASGFTQPLIMGADCTLTGVTVTGGSGADTLRGSAGNDIVGGGAGADIIDAGDGNDIISGGEGADTFQFVAGDLSAAPSATIFDTITDFEKNSDIFDEIAGALVIVSGSTASSGTSAVSFEGICTFDAADDTLAERVRACEAGINASGVAAARQFAIFEHSTNSYIFISDGTDGIGANDVLFQLFGVTGLSDTTLTAGNLWIN